MIDIDVARRLRDAGLAWEPADGDLFAIDNAQLREESFMLSSMVVEVGRGRSGTRLLRFNGTTEWALDSVAAEDALWLPREDQLRVLLGAQFRALRAETDAFAVDTETLGTHRGDSAADAYGEALLAVLRAVTD